LLLDVYGGILEMAGKCLELVALWQTRNCLGRRIVLRWYLGGLVSPLEGSGDGNGPDRSCPRIYPPDPG
jgi:hypothetical protein